MVKYITATIHDFDNLLPLVNAFERDNIVSYQKEANFNHQKSEKDNLKYLRKYLKQKTCTYFLCKQKDKIIGYIFSSKDETYIGDGYINELYILPENRKKGYASKLIALALNWLKEMNCTKIELTVNTKNKNAIKLYEKFNFKIEKEDYISMQLKV